MSWVVPLAHEKESWDTTAYTKSQRIAKFILNAL